MEAFGAAWFGLFSDAASTVKISQSTILDGGDGGTVNKCVACDDGYGSPLNPDCTQAVPTP